MQPTGKSGFTLIEVLIALAILGFSLSMLLSVFSSAMENSRTATSDLTAMLVATSLLESTQIAETPVTGTTNGVTADGVRWALTIRELGTKEDQDAWPAKPYILEARVTPRNDTHSVDLTTIHLVPKERPWAR